jgi:hypothetical protein
MNRALTLVTIFSMLSALGCAHDYGHMQNQLAPGDSGSNVMEAKYAGDERAVAVPEDGYIYSLGIGKLPQDSISQAQGWARAKRAAIDTATANLVTEAEKLHQTGRSTPSVERIEDRAGHLLGTVGQAEIVSVRRLPDGSCEVLMRAPRGRIQTTK